jgi:membrane-associated phospholipid phosphatase
MNGLCIRFPATSALSRGALSIATLCLVAVLFVSASPALAQELDFDAGAAASSGDRALADSASATAPSHTAAKTFFNRGDLELLGIGLAVSAGVSVFDQRVERWWQSSNVQGGQDRHDFVEHLTVINEQPLTLAALATYGIGRLIKSETVADVGLHTTESLLLTVALSEAIRGPVGRARPRTSPDDPYNFSFGDGFTDFGKRSYPSLHAAVAFATATALTREIHARNPGAIKWAAPLMYTVALVPGFTRMYLDQHWSSDVVAGSILGAAIGSKVVGYAHSHRRNRLDRWLLGTTVAPAAGGGMTIGFSRELP